MAIFLRLFFYSNVILFLLIFQCFYELKKQRNSISIIMQMNSSLSQRRFSTITPQSNHTPHSLAHQRSKADLHGRDRVLSKQPASQCGMFFRAKSPQYKQTINRTQSTKNMHHRRKFSNLSTNNQPSKFYNTQKTIKYTHVDTKTQTLCQTSSTMKQIENLDPNKYKTYQPKRKSRDQTRTSQFADRKVNGNWFDVIRQIGKGKYGKVYLVRDKQSGFLMALKAIQKRKLLQSNLLEQFIRQLKIQFYLDHPGIIKLYGFFDDIQNFYLLMQLGCDGQLYDKIQNQKTLSQQSCSFVARNLLNVVEYMHSEKVLHRDIKPQNIVVVLGHIKICDFGWAVYNNTEMRSTFCGTPLYFSPQLLTGKQYDEKVDLWSIGIMAFQLLFATSPFNLKQPQDLSRIITHEVQFPKNAKVSTEFKLFIKKILQKDPTKRPTSKQLLQTRFIQRYSDLEVCEELCRTSKPKLK